MAASRALNARDVNLIAIFFDLGHVVLELR
jgi:hypothetical protein